ncbi:uncharacterized protein V1510DRAFT_419299 [Dipodascopsis tothii]|uniref:uncharacterized protein n=1 Tax=Dipodascopsis tothii TaxID=44089 RepID=UPI0034CF15B0
MSAADVRDMLDLPSKGQGPARPAPKRVKTEQPGKRLDGIHRELYALLSSTGAAGGAGAGHAGSPGALGGEGLMMHPISVIENRFKAKPNWKQKPTPWTWRKFTNEARTDGLELSHWVKGAPADDGEAVAAEYPFAKFNKQVDVPAYTDDEYDEVLQDVSWSRRETDYLFELCREYDLRWFVISDRYEYQAEDGEPRSVRILEDLKERYYSVCRRLMEHGRDKGHVEWSSRDLEVYNAMNFNKEKELMRKQYLERLLSRSPAEIQEEEHLIQEYRRLEEASQKMVTERAELLRLLEAPQTLKTFAQHHTSQGLAQLTSNLLAADKNRKRRAPDMATIQQLQLQQQQAAAQAQASTPHGQKKHHDDKHAAARGAALSKAEQAQNASVKRVAKRVPPGQEDAYGVSFHDKLVPGVFLRSTRISTLKPAIQSKVAGVMAELGIAPKLAMPTSKTCERYEAIQQAVATLLEAKKQADKLDGEIRVLRARKGE